jgi:uncharacterized membrane protein YfcA
LTFGAHLYPIQWLLPVLLPLTLLANLYIFIRHHEQIDVPVLQRRILPFMGAGLVIGFALFNLVHGDRLQTLFGLLVVAVALRELIHLLRGNRRIEAPIRGWMSNAVIFAAGVVHGIYASGGPLLVYAANKMKLPKSVFRSTLATVWLIMNIFLTGSYAVSGKIDAGSLTASAYLLPSLALGVLTGELLHRRIPERGFKMVVFGLLLVSGALIMIK